MNKIKQNAQPFALDNTYASLPRQFHTVLNPVPVKSPKLVKLNIALAAELGIDADFLGSDHGIAILAGNKVAAGSTPIAMAYGGHQFGNWAGRLGDGRAILLGEVISKNAVRYDIQLKGSGPTPYSRGGDGRAWIGPVLREYVISEAMAALGIPTTRALAAVTTGEIVIREERHPGAILTRVSKGHVRIGTFEYFASNNDSSSIKLLADYVIARHYPDIASANNPYLALLERIIKGQAELVAQWMGVGFIHGVMNTDNMSVFGETIDYGPCAFMDGYDPNTVYSFIDQNGRYAYKNQPSIASWNLTSLASTMLELIDIDQDIAIEKAQNAINGFSEIFTNAWTSVFCKKIGIRNHKPNDGALVREFMDILAATKADFTLSFRRLGNELQGDNAPLAEINGESTEFSKWLEKWKHRLAEEKATTTQIQSMMNRVNPMFIPRNHRVEQMIAAALNDEYGEFEKMLKILSSPYEEQPENAKYQLPPTSDEVVRNTFCGT